MARQAVNTALEIQAVAEIEALFRAAENQEYVRCCLALREPEFAAELASRWPSCPVCGGHGPAVSPP